MSMLQKMLLVFRIPELRRKILLTLILLCVYRLGYHVYLPFIDQHALSEQRHDAENQAGGLDTFMQTISLFTASQLNSIFGLGIGPYITASIIFQLLGTVYPPLEALQKEGEAGRRKINEYTRYATVVVCLIQSYVWIRAGMGGMGNIILPEYNTFPQHLVATFTMTAGAVFLMWIGEQIDAYGIGNGISLLIMAGIIARMPDAGVQLLRPAFEHGIRLGTESGIDRFILLAVMFVVVVIWVVAITEGQRRIPIQSAKHVRGRRVMGGQRQSLPLRVNQAGVMPIVFASSILVFPMFVFKQINVLVKPDSFLSPVTAGLADAFSYGRGYIYNTCYILLIYLFCYFWVAVTFNPKDISENLKDYGSFIPGYRPGARTAQFLEQVMTRITYLGAAFLAMVAVIPTLISHWMDIPTMVASFYGGTGLLIVVSVALDLVQKIDSHLVMRNYPGLLDSDS
ncbi:MAG TPA: preprotein translocase subunit SecY [Planctomycetaceae bacterium]|jgi:preprotein translocase subunit SecY|nr:preprotein translocase subunit SecY [Planctomycetaceae bacterium]